MKCEYDCTKDDCNCLANDGSCLPCSGFKYTEEDIMEHSTMTMGPDNMVTINAYRIEHLGVVYKHTNVHYNWRISRWGIGGSTSVPVDEYLTMMNDDDTEVA